jgi:hypothetical protein
MTMITADDMNGFVESSQNFLEYSNNGKCKLSREWEVLILLVAFI